MEYRQLDSTDWDVFYKLANEVNACRGYALPPMLSLENYYFNDSEPQFVAFGAFDDNRVLGVFLVHFSDFERAWRIRFIIKAPNVEDSVMISLLEYIIRYAEDCRFYKCFAGYFDNDGVIFERYFRRSNLLSRYVSVTEDVIPARTVSSFNKYRAELQEWTIFLKPLTVKMYILDEHFRKFN